MGRQNARGKHAVILFFGGRFSTCEESICFGLFPFFFFLNWDCMSACDKKLEWGSVRNEGIKTVAGASKRKRKKISDQKLVCIPSVSSLWAVSKLFENFTQLLIFCICPTFAGWKFVFLGHCLFYNAFIASYSRNNGSSFNKYFLKMLN